MSVDKILTEAVSENPIAFKKLVEEEIRSRVVLALEAKREEMEADEEEMEADQLDEMRNGKIVKDLGRGIKVTIEDGGAVISDRTAPGGRQMVVLEPEQVEKMSSMVKSKKSVKGENLGSGIKMSIDGDGAVVLTDRTSPGGQEMVVLEPEQVDKIMSMV